MLVKLSLYKINTVRWKFYFALHACIVYALLEKNIGGNLQLKSSARRDIQRMLKGFRNVQTRVIPIRMIGVNDSSRYTVSILSLLSLLGVGWRLSWLSRHDSGMSCTCCRFYVRTVDSRKLTSRCKIGRLLLQLE